MIQITLADMSIVIVCYICSANRRIWFQSEVILLISATYDLRDYWEVMLYGVIHIAQTLAINFALHNEEKINKSNVHIYASYATFESI